MAPGVLPGLAVTLLLFGPFGVASLMGWAYVEAATACVLVAAGLAWLIWYQSRAAALLKLSGLLAGLGVSFKMTAALLPVALFVLTGLLLLREAREQGKPLASTVKLLLPMALCVTLPVLSWFVRSALVTGNPVFPMFAGLIPSRDFTALQSKQFDQYNRYMVWGIGAGASWGLGLRKLILAAALAGLAVPGVLLAWRQRWMDRQGERKWGTITQLDTALNPKAEWKFFRGVPVKWEISEFDGSKSELAIETLEIAHEGLTYTAIGGAD